MALTVKISAPNARFNQRCANTTSMNHATIAILAMASLILAALFIAGCTSPETAPKTAPPEQKSPEMTPPPRSPAEVQESVVDANNQFAFDL
jgi:hypothetical protein